MTLDTTRFGAQMAQDLFTCEVLDVPAGDPPKLLTVRLPGIDGPANVARYFGAIDVSVGDDVTCQRDPTDQDILIVVSNFAGSTVGGGVWPLAGNLVNTADGSGFTTVATLITDLASDEQGIIGEGSFACVNLTLAADEHLLGSGHDVTELTNSTNGLASLVASGGNTIQDMTIHNTTSTGATVLRAEGAGVVCRNVKTVATASSNGAVGFYASGASAELSLFDCVAICGGGSGTDVALQAATSGAVLNAHGGYFDGDVVASSAGTTINLYGPTITGSVAASGSGTVTGYYFDADDKLWALIDGTPTQIISTMGARVNHSTTQSISHSTFTALSFDQENYDEDVFHDTSTNNTRITIPDDCKGYTYGCIEYEVNAAGQRVAGIRLNGTTYLVLNTITAASGAKQRVIAFTEYDFSATDYIELMTLQNSGVSLNVESAVTHFGFRIIKYA